MHAIVLATHTTPAPHANLGPPGGGARAGAAAFATALGLAAEHAITQANNSLQPASCR